MGRVKTKLIKRVTLRLYKEHKNEFKKDFNKNKAIVEKLIDLTSKKIRNIVAGYITRLVKNQEESNQK